MEVYEIVAITLLLELFENFFQYGKTIKEMIFKLYKIYSISPFLFFLLHLDYLWLLYLSLKYSNLSWSLIFAVALKTFDIFTKLDLIKRVFITPDKEVKTLLELSIPWWLYIAGVLTYPYLVYISFLN